MNVSHEFRCCLCGVRRVDGPTHSCGPCTLSLTLAAYEAEGAAEWELEQVKRETLRSIEEQRC